MPTPRKSSSLTRQDQAPACGLARAKAHHGELIQGVFEDSDGHLRRALVTLPLHSKHSVALFQPHHEPSIRVQPSDRVNAARAAEITLQRLKANAMGGTLVIDSEIPVGHGYGSSSADVIAAIRAVFNAFGHVASATITSEIAVAAEGASDATAFEETAVLFAHREGKVLQHLGGNLPPLAVVSFKAASAIPISTTALPRARYDAEEIQAFRCALSAVRRSVQLQDPRLIGQAASLSSCISQRHLPKPGFDAAYQIVRRNHASGLQVSHSGSLMGILVDATIGDLRACLSAIADDLGQAGFMDVERLMINAEFARP